MDNEIELTKELNQVLARTYDAVKGYDQVLNHTENPALKALFKDQLFVRNNFILELSRIITALGSDPVDEGTCKGFTHRRWINLKVILASDLDDAVIEECIRGERKALDDLEHLLTYDMPLHGNLRSLLNEHRRQLEQSIFHLRSVESIVSQMT